MQALKDAGFADAQASIFASQWQVVAHVDEVISSLSVTVFETVANGTRHVAIKTTTFVNEIISDADKQRIDFSTIRRAPADVGPILPWKWTIDRERDVFLIETGYGRDEDQDDAYFVLWWQARQVLVTLRARFEGANAKVVVWQLRELKIPDCLEVSRDEVLNVLREALEVFGFLNRRQNLDAVRVQF